MKISKAWAVLLSAGVSIIAVSAPAIAQDEPPQVPAREPVPGRAGDSQAGGTLEEIVVTAQKRSQNLQTIPVSVTAFTADKLSALGITTVQDVQRVDSAVTIATYAGVAVPYMRGIGSSVVGSGNESSVAAYIDDVYYSRLAAPLLELANIERVEVLKGPQGTLFGRNASGGLFNIYTREPGLDRLALEATLGLARYETVTGKLYASAPLGEKAAIDLSVSASHQGEGWGKNIFTGKDFYRAKHIAVRSKLVLLPTDTTKITIGGWYFDSQSQLYISGRIFPGFVSGTPNVCNLGARYAVLCPVYGPSRPITGSDTRFYDVNLNFGGNVYHEGYGASLKVEQDVGFASLVSITSYRHAPQLWKTQNSFSIYPWQAYYLDNRDDQTTQEFQLKSKNQSSVDWILGLYYFNSRSGYNPGRVIGDSLQPGSSGPDLGDPTFQAYQDINSLQVINSYSAYGQATFHVIPDGTNITLGLRYNIDRLRGSGNQVITFNGGTTFSPGGASFKGKKEFNKLTYKVAVDHRFSPAAMGYVSFSRGYKSGVYNTLPLVTDPIRPEVVQAYEVGLKTDLFDRRARLNIAAFWNDITDAQVQVIRVVNGIASAAPTNAAKVRSRGVELNAEALLTDDLTVRLGADYLISKYRSFRNAPFFIPRTVAPFGNIQTAGDATGNYLNQAPKFKANAGVNYRRDTAIGELGFDANVSYTGKFYWTPDNLYRNRAYALVDAALFYQPASQDHFSVRLWVKNLTAKKYFAYSQATTVAHSATVGAPRTFGIELTYKH